MWLNTVFLLLILPIALAVTLWLSLAFVAVLFPPSFWSQILPASTAYAVGAGFIIRFIVRRFDPRYPAAPAKLDRVVLGMTMLAIIIFALMLLAAFMGYITPLEGVVIKALAEMVALAFMRRFW